MKRLISFALLASTLLLTGAGCSGATSAETSKAVTIKYWRVFDGEDDFSSIIDAYRGQHPNVTIDYRRLRFEEYEEELIRAFAEGKGPDIFTIHNTELQAYQSLISPMPTQITISQREKRNRFSQEMVDVPVTKPTLTMRELKDRFVEQVVENVVIRRSTSEGSKEEIYGLPLALDTMVLYYNVDLLNAAGIPQPPKTWNDFQEQVIKLTRYDAKGELLQSGAALGSADNVERSTDILSTIMAQVGVNMTNSQGRVSFTNKVNTGETGYSAAIRALGFYTDFSNKGKEVYTWNDAQPNSLQAFISGQTAFFFGYAYHAPIIRTNAPRLKFEVTGFPQLTGDNVAKAYFANYWIEAVSSSSKNKNWAWDFLLFATSDEQAAKYLNRAQKPTAHKNLIKGQLSDEFLGPFAEQVLLARNWYEGEDVGAMETALRELITQFTNGVSEEQRAIQNAERKIQQTY